MSAILGAGVPLTAKGLADGTPTASYRLPDLGVFVVETVVAEIDANGGDAPRPTLRVRDKSGAVIATKRQGESVPAGDTGSATWALRLDDNVAPVYTSAEFVFAADDGITIKGEACALYFGPAPGENGAAGNVTPTLPFLGAIGDEIHLGVNVNLPGFLAGFLTRACVLNTTTGQSEVLSGNTVFVNGPGSALFTWDLHDSGAVLLDRTNPARPTLLVAGAYVIAGNVAFGF